MERKINYNSEIIYCFHPWIGSVHFTTLFTDLEQALYNSKTFPHFQNYRNPVIKLCNQTTTGRPLAYATHLLVPQVVVIEDRLNCTVLSLAHRREHITHVSKQLHWLPVRCWIDTKSCPWHAKLWGYGARILAETHSLIYCYTGTHSLTYSCITLRSSLQPCLWSGAKKHTKTKTTPKSLVSEHFPTLLPSSGMPYQKQPGK